MECERVLPTCCFVEKVIYFNQYYRNLFRLSCCALVVMYLDRFVINKPNAVLVWLSGLKKIDIQKLWIIIELLYFPAKPSNTVIYFVATSMKPFTVTCIMFISQHYQCYLISNTSIMYHLTQNSLKKTRSINDDTLIIYHTFVDSALI